MIILIHPFSSKFIAGTDVLLPCLHYSGQHFGDADKNYRNDTSEICVKADGSK
jgi:hypothetical protein